MYHCIIIISSYQPKNEHIYKYYGVLQKNQILLQEHANGLTLWMSTRVFRPEVGSSFIFNYGHAFKYLLS